MAKITVQNTEITVLSHNDKDYISLTDMARSQLQEHIIFRWLSLKSTIEYLGEWEILYNAIAHKDYTGPDIQMHVYDDHLEIWNEGELPMGYSQETLYGNHPSKPRNLNIANAFFKAGFIDTWGRGYKKIREGFEPAGIPMPKVENFCGGVQVTIERTQFMKMLNGGKNGGRDSSDIPVIELTERQRVILELISGDPTLSAKALSEKMSEKMSEKSSVNERTIERDIAKLKKLDYLRRIGGKKDGHWEVIIPLNSVVEIV